MKHQQGYSKERALSLTVVGGGNIGSFLVPLLVRGSNIKELRIIDFDICEATNVGQNFQPNNAGKHKAQVLASAAQKANPTLRVEAIIDRVENVPLGRLRGSVILACVDSREARRVINQVAWRLGVPWIDAGVNARLGLFGRVTPYKPGEESPCLECAWDAADYDALEQVYPCHEQMSEVASTNAPASLGALTASLQAIKCAMVTAGDLEHVGFGQQVLVDALGGTLDTMEFRRTQNCRFDHRTWRVKPYRCILAKTTIHDIHVLARELFRAAQPTYVTVEDKPFVRRVRCTHCGKTWDVFRLWGRLNARANTCSACGRKTIPEGFTLIDRLFLKGGSKQLMKRSLRSIGFRMGDIFTLGYSAASEAQYEITRD